MEKPVDKGELEMISECLEALKEILDYLKKDNKNSDEKTYEKLIEGALYLLTSQLLDREKL